MWRDFIRKSVARAVADYLATNKPGSRTRSERPTAPLLGEDVVTCLLQLCYSDTLLVLCSKSFNFVRKGFRK